MRKQKGEPWNALLTIISFIRKINIATQQPQLKMPPRLKVAFLFVFFSFKI